MAAIQPIEAVMRLRRYLTCHLAEQGGELNDLKDEIMENIEHPDRNPKPDERAEFLLKLAREKLDYIAQGVKDLQELEKGGS